MTINFDVNFRRKKLSTKLYIKVNIKHKNITLVYNLNSVRHARNTHKESLDVHQINTQFDLDHNELKESDSNFGGFNFHAGLRHFHIN